jgi:acyl carrier protein
MKEQLQQVFRNVFRNSVLIIHEGTTAKDISSWDSLTHLELIAAVEERFGIKFTFSEVMTFNTVGDMLLLIEKRSENKNQE